MVLVLILAVGLIMSYAPGPWKLAALPIFALLLWAGDEPTHPRV
jgi:hypothetical protein